MSDENVVFTEESVEQTITSPITENTLPVTEPSGPNYNKLTAVEITSEVVALNVMVSFLNLAQKRGAFNIDESAKIWECIKKFIPSAGSD